MDESERMERLDTPEFKMGEYYECVRIGEALLPILMKYNITGAPFREIREVVFPMERVEEARKNEQGFINVRDIIPDIDE